MCVRTCVCTVCAKMGKNAFDVETQIKLCKGRVCVHVQSLWVSVRGCGEGVCRTKVNDISIARQIIAEKKMSMRETQIDGDKHRG